ncbi:unnamed protein product [Rangifer tarandus platyrhynchus]|uniref:Uncharacterized protein n=1 Tax=Rangifer tarandus platyrhynchus TaxID=3082113 RepID=A0AC59YV85_RANTA
MKKEMATHSSILPGKPHGQRNLVGYSPWDHKRDTSNKETYEVLLKRKIFPQWEKCLFEKVHNKFYQEMIVHSLSILNAVYNPRNDINVKDRNVFLVGKKATGKMMIIK